MLEELLSGQRGQSSTGTVVTNLLDGYYQVLIGANTVTVRNQAGPISIGSIVTVTNTKWGNFIVSSSGTLAETTKKVVIIG